jgi:hypothetical protein
VQKVLVFHRDPREQGTPPSDGIPEKTLVLGTHHIPDTPFRAWRARWRGFVNGDLGLCCMGHQRGWRVVVASVIGLLSRAPVACKVDLPEGGPSRRAYLGGIPHIRPPPFILRATQTPGEPPGGPCSWPRFVRDVESNYVSGGLPGAGRAPPARPREGLPRAGLNTEGRVVVASATTHPQCLA